MLRTVRQGFATLLIPLAVFVSAGCGGGHDAHAIAADMEGTISSDMIARMVKHADLEHVPLTLQAEPAVNEQFANGDQNALESFLREAADGLSGDSVRVAQEVLDDTGANTQRLTVTLAVEHAGTTRYVPVVMDLVREGRTTVIARARVLASTR